MSRLILGIVFFVHISLDILSQDADSLKCWCKNDKLKWSDFRGKKPEDEDSFLGARTAIGIIPLAFRKDDALNYQVKVVVRRYDSWKTDTAKHLLIHEQLHFDIAELTARKLRKAIEGLRRTIPKPTAQDFRAVIQKLFGEDANMQAQYDKDTVHGIIAESQIKWEKKISLELKNFEKYASRRADCELH